MRGGGRRAVGWEHKAFVRPISITKSPWFVFEVCCPLSCASLTPTLPPHPIQAPQLPMLGCQNSFRCLNLICCVCKCTSLGCQTQCITPQTERPLSPATPYSHARLLSPCSYSPLLIPLRTGWRPNTHWVRGLGCGIGWGCGRQDQTGIPTPPSYSLCRANVPRPSLGDVPSQVAHLTPPVMVQTVP